MGFAFPFERHHTRKHEPRATMTTPFHLLLLLLACHAIASGLLSSSHSLPRFARNMEVLNPDRRLVANAIGLQRLLTPPPMIFRV